MRHNHKTALPITFFVALLALCLVCTQAMAGGKPPKGKKDAAKKGADKAELEMPAETKREWPPGEWKMAKAYTFNFERFGPGMSLYIFNDGKWNKNIRSEREISQEQAERALAMTHRTRGEVLVSKCPLPRHAVVFFDEAGEPLGSVNVCFECGDILVWPAYLDEEPEQTIFELSVDEEDEDSERLIYAIHEQVMPRWETFFKELGEPIDYREVVDGKEAEEDADGETGR